MKNRIKITLFVVICFLLCILLGACGNSTDHGEAGSTSLSESETTAGEEPFPQKVRNISTDTVKYSGWRDFISGEGCVLSGGAFDQNRVDRFDLKTGEITGVCQQNDCKHLKPFQDDTNPCRIPSNSDLFFVRNGKVYYKYSESSYDEIEMFIKGHTKMIHTHILAEYDISTGEYSELLSFVGSDIEQMFTFIHDGEYIYYVRFIPKNKEPDNIEDYSLSLCRLGFENREEEILFAFEDCCDLKSGVIPDPLAVLDGFIYFSCNQTGQLFKVGLDGKNFSYLIDGKQGFMGLFDAYGTFYRDGKIYFTEYAQEADQTITTPDVLIPYCIDCKTGELQKLSNDYVRWIFVTDDSVFYELAGTQRSENQQKTIYEDRSEHIIKEISFDGVEKNRYTVKIDYTKIQGVWGAGKYLFFLTGYRRDTDGTSFMDIYTMTLNLEDGSVTEYGRTDSED